MQIVIERIRIDGNTQSRVELNNDVVRDYAESMKEGAAFPPVTLYFDGADYWLADGFHRYFATKSIGEKTINSVIESGTSRDAVYASLCSNSTHGLRRTNADKRKAVLTIFADEEWSKWSDRVIARELDISNDLVSRMRREIVRNKDVETVFKDTTPAPMLEIASENDEIAENPPLENVEKLAEIKTPITEEVDNNHYSEIDQLKDTNSELRDIIEGLNYQISVANYDGAEPIEEIVKELRITKANLKQVTIARNSLQNELAACKRNEVYLNKKIKELQKSA